MVTIRCAVCGVEKEIPKKECDRQNRRGRSHFFCGRSCAAVARNAPRRVQDVQKTCPWCGKTFESTTKAKAASYCSRSCASKSSVTDARRNCARKIGKLHATNLTYTVEQTANGLRKREGWKYVRLATFLLGKGVRHQFEYPLEHWVFDLALFDTKTLIEFNGPYHNTTRQRDDDGRKTGDAKKCGWQVTRVLTAVGVIDPTVLKPFV